VILELTNSMNRKFLLTFLLVFVSCQRPATTPDILDRDKFVSTYIALLERSSPVRTGGPDSTYFRDKAAILAQQGVTEAQFRGTIRSYAASPKEWKDFFDEVILRLGRQVLEEREKASPPLGALMPRAAPSSR
jgi:hypothetical protein